MRGYNSPEVSLLMLAARLDINHAEAEQIEGVLKHGVDWSYVRDYADQLGVNPLLYRHLSKERFVSQVPEEMMQCLSTQYKRNAFKNLRIYGQLYQVLDALKPYNVKVILLKGVFLAKWVYKDIALRPLSDIDILIEKRDKGILQQIMAELGYIANSIVYQSILHKNFFTERMNHLPAFYRTNNVKIDVHINPFAKNTQDTRNIKNMWESVIPSELNGLRIYLLSPEYQLLHLCYHLYQHMLSNSGLTLYWFCDIYELLRYYNGIIDWNLFYSLQYSLGMRTHVDKVIKALNATYWDRPIPKGDLSHINAKSHNSCPHSLFKMLFNQGSNGRSYRLEDRINLTKQIKGWKNRLYFLIKFIFPDKEYLMYLYATSNPFIIHLYFYIVHPYRICKRLILSILDYPSQN